MDSAASLKPGLNVNIVFTLDFEKDSADIRTSVIYDIIGQDVILSQTDRPVVSQHLKKDVSVTYLVREKDNMARLGFEGKVANIINDYNLNSSNIAAAILIKRYTGIKKYNLRMSYRVKPRSDDTSLTLHVANNQVTILDISTGGVFFSHKSVHPTEAGITQKVSLIIGGESFQVDSKTITAWFPSGAGRPQDLEYVRLQFLGMDRQCSRLLNEKIFALQRETLSNPR